MPTKKDRETDRRYFPGYCFIRYTSVAAANSACHQFKGSNSDGRAITVTPSNKPTDNVNYQDLVEVLYREDKNDGICDAAWQIFKYAPIKYLLELRKILLSHLENVKFEVTM